MARFSGFAARLATRRDGYNSANSSMRASMRLVPVLILVLFLAPVAARGESWVHTRDNGGGYPMCFDTASVKTDRDGLTHYAVKMCNDSTPQFYAVDCT